MLLVTVLRTGIYALALVTLREQRPVNRMRKKMLPRMHGPDHNLYIRSVFSTNFNSLYLCLFNVCFTLDCGNLIYNPKTHICCCGKLHAKKAKFSCCGYYYYNSLTGKCCPYSSVKAKNAYCPRSKI